MDGTGAERLEGVGNERSGRVTVFYTIIAPLNSALSAASLFSGSRLVIQVLLSAMYEKAKGKVKKFVAHFPSRSSTPPTGQSILTGQPTTHLHRSSSTNTLDQAGVASPTGLLPPKSVVASPPSTAAQVDASASETRSPQESKSKRAKDLFKTTLVLLNTTLAGVPLPCKGVFTAVIEIINIVEVITSYYREFECNSANSYGGAQKTAANEDELKKLDKRCNLIRELIEDALKGKDESRVPVELKDSILQLQKYA